MKYEEFVKNTLELNRKLLKESNTYSEDNNSLPWRVDLIGKDKVVVLGLNPANKLVNQDDRFAFLGCFEMNSNKENDALNNKLNKLSLIYNKYYQKQYRLFENIDAKMYWANSKSIYNSVLDRLESNNLQKLWSNVFNIQNNKNGPYIVFTDLFSYHETSSKNIKDAIEIYKKNNSMDEYKKIISNLYDNIIEYYNPKMLIVTNAYASDIILECVSYISEENDRYYADKKYGVRILFSGMITSSRALDNHSFRRFKYDIKELWNLIKST